MPLTLIISIALTVLVSLSSPAFAENSPFATLPYDIVIGKTKADEIEGRATCEETIKVREQYFRCKRYKFRDGFEALMSQNETVQRLWMSHLIRMPRTWKKAGLDWNISRPAFIIQIKKMGAHSIKETEDQYEGWWYVSFESGDYVYKAEFLEAKGGFFILSVEEAF